MNLSLYTSFVYNCKPRFPIFANFGKSCSFRRVFLQTCFHSPLVNTQEWKRRILVDMFIVHSPQQCRSFCFATQAHLAPSLFLILIRLVGVKSVRLCFGKFSKLAKNDICMRIRFEGNIAWRDRQRWNLKGSFIWICAVLMKGRRLGSQTHSSVSNFLNWIMGQWS